MSVVGRAAAAVVFFLVAGLMPSALAVTNNDDLVNAVTISGASGTTSDSNSGYSSQAGEPNHAPPDTGGASAWFSWTAPSTGRFRFDTIGSNFDTLLAVYTGDDIANLSLVANNNDRLATNTMPAPKVSAVGIDAVEGTVYRIVVDGRHNGTSAAQGSYTLNWKLGPANDDFASATLIEGTSGALDGTLVGSTKQHSPLDPVDRYTVWYKYIPATNGMLTLRNNRFGADLSLGLYSGAHGSLTQVGFHNNTFNPTRIDKNVIAGTTYHIMVASPSEDTFPLTWSLGPTLTNDDVSNPIVLSGDSGNTSGSTVGATRVSNPQEIGGSFGTTTVWYQWSTPSTQPVTFEAGGGSYGVAVFQIPQGTCTNTAVCWNGKNMIRDANPRVQFTPVANQTYWIQVSGQPPGGSFTLKWVRPPAHDASGTPFAISGQTGSQQSNNLSAGKEAGELNHAGNNGGASVWFSWQAPSSDPIEFDTYGSNFDTLLAVYPGGNPTGTPLASNNDFLPCCQDKTSRVGFDPTAGSTYLIVVDGGVVNSPGSMSGLTASVGDIVLNWNVSPANDDFASRQLIEGASDVVNPNTVGATREANESTSHGASVWYRWVAPGAGRLEVTTAGSPPPDRAVIYSGNALNSLQQNVSGGRTDTVYGQVSEGTEYSIAAFHNGHVTGPLQMSWQFVPAPVTEIISGPTGTVNTSTVAFEFGPNQQNMGFLCELNGRTLFQCPRLLTLDNLLNGEYTLTVRAIDGVGTQDPTPEQRTWTVNAPARERLDAAFDGEGVATTTIGNPQAKLHDLAVDGDKVIAVGASNGPNGEAAIVRYLPSGALDTTFSGDGIMLLDVPCQSCPQPGNQNFDEIKAAIPVAGNKLLVAGDATYSQQQQCFMSGNQLQCFVSNVSRRVFLARLNDDGTLDTTFGTNGFRFYQQNDSMLADAEIAGGKLFLAGTIDTGAAWNPFVGAVALDGTPDTTFDSDGFAINNATDGKVTDLTVPAGKPVVSVQMFNANGFKFLRFNSEGAADSGFGGGDGEVNHSLAGTGDIAFAITHDSQGRIVAGGRAGGNPHHTGIVRMNPSGSLDPTFNPCDPAPAPCGGKIQLQLGTQDSQVRDLLILPNDKIVVASRAQGPSEVFFLTRLLTNGSFDTTFSGDGRLMTGWTYQAGAFIEDLERDNQGRLLAGGSGSGVGDFVVARYTADPKRQVSVTIVGDGSVGSSPEGIACSSGTCNGEFEDGTSVMLIANPGQHQKFDGWTGDCSSVSGGTCTISNIDAAKNVTATFSQITHNLTVALSGDGSVSSDPTGLSCPSTCTHAFNQGQTITLTPTPAENKQFNGWTGDCSLTPGQNCVVQSIAAARNVTAHFGPKMYELSVTVDGNGLGDVSSSPNGIVCPTDCTGDFAHGSDASLLAFPRNANYRFVSWSGCTSTSGNQCFVEDITSNKQVTATFGLVQYNVSVTFGGNGSGSVSSTPGGISCSSNPCSAPFDKGTNVVLTATPGANQQFDGWTGECSSTEGATCTITSISDQTDVTATFVLPAVYKPDVLVKKAADSKFVGDDVYNANGKNQTVSMNAKRGTAKTFNFKLENDGNVVDTYEISGPDNSSGFTVKYFLGKENITSKLVDGEFKPAVQPSATKVLKVVIAVKSGARIGASKSVLLTALSTNAEGKLDAAKALVKVIRG